MKCLNGLKVTDVKMLAAKRLGIEAIGIEMNEEYCEIARNRLKNH
jgi:DNA modification methylase